MIQQETHTHTAHTGKATDKHRMKQRTNIRHTEHLGNMQDCRQNKRQSNIACNVARTLLHFSSKPGIVGKYVPAVVLKPELQTKVASDLSPGSPMWFPCSAYICFVMSGILELDFLVCALGPLGAHKPFLIQGATFGLQRGFPTTAHSKAKRRKWCLLCTRDF